jgi:serine/threonine protein kinase
MRMLLLIKDLIKSDKDKYRAVKDITEGLEHLRQKRIVHRDLKLENIMVRINKDKSKSYVLTDFGLACWIG